MSQPIVEPLRDCVGRALYEEPGHQGDWYSLSEERREPWRLDADRAIAVMHANFSKLETAMHRIICRADVQAGDDFNECKRQLAHIGAIAREACSRLTKPSTPLTP